MRLRSLPVLLAACLAAGTALAADPPPPPAPAATTPPAAPEPVAKEPAPAARAPASPQSRAVLSQVEKRIADLHERLHITPAEQPVWQSFSETMRQNARDMDQMVQQRHAGLQSMTAVADMQSYADLAQAHASQMQKLVPAFATLYDAMSPAQKKQADDVFKAFQNQAAAGRRSG